MFARTIHQEREHITSGKYDHQTQSRVLFGLSDLPHIIQYTTVLTYHTFDKRGNYLYPKLTEVLQLNILMFHSQTCFTSDILI